MTSRVLAFKRLMVCEGDGPMGDLETELAVGVVRAGEGFPRREH